MGKLNSRDSWQSLNVFSGVYVKGLFRFLVKGNRPLEWVLNSDVLAP